MTAIKSHHSRVFAQLMAEYRQTMVDALVVGNLPDHAAYRHRTGVIHGLDDALRISEEADFKISGEEPDAGA